jgi:hypothetical protein
MSPTMGEFFTYIAYRTHGRHFPPRVRSQVAEKSTAQRLTRVERRRDCYLRDIGRITLCGFTTSTVGGQCRNALNVRSA